jgi:predicted enzyme related to lactoylglutathione lyase
LFLYPVKDIERAKTFYSKLLGVEPYADSPYYVGFRVDDQEIGLVPNDNQNDGAGPIGYWQVNDIKASLHSLLDAGAQTHQPVRDVGGGRLVASVKDTEGNLIGLRQDQ